MTRVQATGRTAGREERRGRIRAVLMTIIPELSGTDLAAALQSIESQRGTGLRDLDDHLAVHPGALTSGNPRCPLALVRITRALNAAGHTAIVSPGCRICGRAATELPFNSPAGRSCRRCYAKANEKTCARCGQAGHIIARREEGGICRACYAIDPQVVEECGDCGQVKRPAVRRPDGTVICESCWTPPVRTCTSCGIARPASLGPEGALCNTCYRRLRQPRRACGRCGLIRPVAVKATVGSPDLCYNCSGLLPPGPCAICGKIKPGYNHAVHGFVCRSCRPHHTEPCSGCGRLRRVQARWPIGPACPGCYVRILSHPADCPQCGMARPLIARAGDGTPVCGPCTGIPDAYLCSGCGTSGRLYAEGLCPRCLLPRRLQHHLAGPDGQVAAQLTPVLHALTAAKNPHGVLWWLKRSPNAQLLAELAASGETLSHDLLDDLPPSPTEYYVRQILIHTGVLPERNDDLDRIPAWLDQALAGRPAGHARLIRPFVHWFLLRRARRRAALLRRTDSSGAGLRSRVRVALELLTWLDEQGIPLERLTQDQLDRWLAAGNTRTYQVRRFLQWATGRGLAPDLTIPPVPRQDPVQFLDEDDRWTQLNRCINDTTLPLDVRAVGALILLFGLPVSRILLLHAGDLSDHDGSTYLAFGSHPMILPPKVAALLHQLTAAPRQRPLIEKHSAPTWLFPGRTPGRPASRFTLSDKLQAHGIDTRPARNAALVALIGDIPAPVLADLLDLHPNTTVRWATLAKRDWTSYLNARAEDLNRRNTAHPE